MKYIIGEPPMVTQSAKLDLYNRACLNLQVIDNVNEFEIPLAVAKVFRFMKLAGMDTFYQEILK